MNDYPVIAIWIGPFGPSPSRELAVAAAFLWVLGHQPLFFLRSLEVLCALIVAIKRPLTERCGTFFGVLPNVGFEPSERPESEHHVVGAWLESCHALYQDRRILECGNLGPTIECSEQLVRTWPNGDALRINPELHQADRRQ